MVAMDLPERVARLERIVRIQTATISVMLLTITLLIVALMIT